MYQHLTFNKTFCSGLNKTPMHANGKILGGGVGSFAHSHSGMLSGIIIVVFRLFWLIIDSGGSLSCL